MPQLSTRVSLTAVAVAMAAAVAVAAGSGAVVTAIPLWAAVTGPVISPIPAADQETLRRSLEKAAGLVPAPRQPYVLDPEGTSLTIDPSAPWDPRSKAWARPGRAAAERYYEVPEEGPGRPVGQRELLGPIEVKIDLNGESRLSDLGSEGGPAALLPLHDIVAVEIPITVPGSAEGRVASMTPAQSAYRLAALTVFIGDPKTEARIRDAVRRGSNPPPALGRSRNPAGLRLIIIRLHGPKEPIEDLARRIPAASLRRLLRP